MSAYSKFLKSRKWAKSVLLKTIHFFKWKMKDVPKCEAQKAFKSWEKQYIWEPFPEIRKGLQSSDIIWLRSKGNWKQMPGFQTQLRSSMALSSLTFPFFGRCVPLLSLTVTYMAGRHSGFLVHRSIGISTTLELDRNHGMLCFETLCLKSAAELRDHVERHLDIPTVIFSHYVLEQLIY